MHSHYPDTKLIPFNLAGITSSLPLHFIGSRTGATGTLDAILVREFERIRVGNVLMYYPEANVLVPRTADPNSRTPAFKGVVVTVQAMPSS